MYTYTIYPDKAFAVVKFMGHVTREEILTYYQDIYEHPDYSEEFCGVADLREAILEVIPSDIPEFGEIGASNTTGKWVLLVTEPQNTAFALLYSDVATKKHPLIVASETATASNFLNFDVAPYLDEPKSASSEADIHLPL